MEDPRQAMVAVGARHVRLLTAGRGPAVLLLHGSPNTADALRPLINVLRGDFLVVAPDSPGNGASDPLPGAAPDAEVYADALAALLDALDLGVVAVYGYHTGAVFAAELARRHPSRVSCVVCDGFPVWTEAEARELADDYLPPLVPTPDGAHLASLWSRVIDQNWYFPWHLKDAKRRIDKGVDDIDRLHTRAMELLQAGDHYRAPYAAALKADGVARIGALCTPTLVTAAPDDALASHLGRLPRHRWLTVQRAAGATHGQVREWFQRHPAPAGRAHLGVARRRFVDTPNGQLLVDGARSASVVWFHDAGESSLAMSGSLGADDMLRLDLPGHGLSTMPWPADAQELKVALTAALREADIDVLASKFLGKGLGRQVAALLAGGIDRFESRQVAVPQIAPRWDGGHLLAAWHFARFRTQYPVWSDRAAGSRGRAPLPSADELHRMTLDVLRAGQRTLKQTLPLGFTS